MKSKSGCRGGRLRPEVRSASSLLPHAGGDDDGGGRSSLPPPSPPPSLLVLLVLLLLLLLLLPFLLGVVLALCRRVKTWMRAFNGLPPTSSTSLRGTSLIAQSNPNSSVMSCRKRPTPGRSGKQSTALEALDQEGAAGRRAQEEEEEEDREGNDEGEDEGEEGVLVVAAVVLLALALLLVAGQGTAAQLPQRPPSKQCTARATIVDESG